MDHDRLCSWLGLPPGSWPPDHYTLLGLPRGTGDLANVEACVLERMEQLRPHQLLHPELVTEGMNRLAQALICLANPAARSAHDRTLGLISPPIEATRDKPAPREVIFTPGLLPAGEKEDEPELDPLPYKVAPYEVVEDELPPRPAFEVVPDDELLESEALLQEAVADEPLAPIPIDRRAVYRQLAAVRRALRAWETLRPVLGTPAETMATPVAVLMFVRALAAARTALPGVTEIIRSPGSPGGTVAALVRQPHALHAVRVLLPAQRQAVALDWRRGHEELLRTQRRMRATVRAARPTRRSSAFAEALRAVGRTPEWLLLAAGFVAMLLALLRRNS